MFERFTDQARRVVVLSQEAARELGHNYIGTEHVLLGLLSPALSSPPSWSCVGTDALSHFDISYDKVHAAVKEIIGQNDSRPVGHIPFTPRAKKVMELSLREALQLHHNYIGTEHVLLGLIREGDGVGIQVLVKLGVDPSSVRKKVMELLSLPTLSGTRSETGTITGTRSRTDEAIVIAGFTPSFREALTRAVHLAASEGKLVNTSHLASALAQKPPDLADD